MIKVHDKEILRYEVNLKEKNIMLITQHKEFDTESENIILFKDVLAHFLKMNYMGGQLKEAITKEMTLCESITDIYEGDAREEMEMFLGSLTQQTYKLLQFYMKLQSFITQTYETFYHHDELMMGYMKSRGFIIE